MKIKSMWLRNFRAYENKTTVPFNNFTAFVGKNDAGKSTILDALAIFFGEEKPELGDACVFGDATAVEISVVFDRFPAKLNFDRGAVSDLASEFLLNSEGDLEIVKRFNLGGSKVGLPEVFALAVHPSADGVSKLLQLSNPQLKALIREQGLEDECDLSANPTMRKALYTAAGDLATEERLVSLTSDTNSKAVWGALEKYLPAFAIFRSDRPSTDQDPEAQNPMNTAVQKALADVQPELTEVSNKVRASLEDTAQRTLDELRASYPDLANALTPSFREPNWAKLFKIDLESDDGVPLNKRGSGVRRLVLMSFFQAEARKKREGRSDATVIYAVEEPETSQHPDNQERILDALAQLAESGDQVIVTTHTPALAGLMPVDGLVFVDSEPAQRTPRVRRADKDVLAEIAGSLGVLPDPLDTKTAQVAVVVEGSTDIDAIVNFAKTLAEGGHIDPLDHDTIFFVPAGGDCLKDWVERNYLRTLEIPQVIIFDSDVCARGEVASEAKQQRLWDINDKDNSVGFMTRKREMENYVHLQAIERLSEGLIKLPEPIDLDYADVSKEFGEQMRDAIDNRGLMFCPTHPDGASIPTRKAKSKEIICAFIFANMTCEEILARFSYEEDGITKSEIVDWIGAIQRFCQ